MKFNDHSKLEGTHALFGASQSHWLRYDDEKIIDKYLNRNKVQLGTELHEYAKTQIDLMQRVSSVKSLMHDVATFIYTKYSLTKENPQPQTGMNLIKSLNYIPRDVFETLKMYINDAIGYKMKAEVILYYSDNCYGTADTISFRNRILRIHDFKSGKHKADMEQLEMYTALFCLEYRMKIGVDIDEVELRLYQNDEIITHNPTAEDIEDIMKMYIHVTKLTENIDEED